jgi:Restriction endonuclease S subunits
MKYLSGNIRPFNIPNKWLWAYFGEMTFNRDSERIPIEKAERESRHGDYDYYGASGIIDTIDDYLFDQPLLLIGEDGANLINRSTPIAFIAFGKYWVNNHAHVIDGISLEFLRYLEIYINSIDLKPYLTGMAQPKLNQAKLNSISVPLPPLAEQHRIVEKVDRLMALCDQLEAQLKNRAGVQERFAKAVVGGIAT